MAKTKRLTAAQRRETKEQTAAEAMLWATLEKLAKSEYTREELAAGKYPVEILISAVVAGQEIDVDVSAETNVQGGGEYHPSIKAPADHLLAILWSHLRPDDRLQLSIELPKAFEADKALPPVDEEHLAAIKKLTNQLTARGPAKPKAGAINATRK